MSISKKEVLRSIGVDFNSDWFQLDEPRSEPTLRARILDKMQAIFPYGSKVSSAPLEYDRLLKAMRPRFLEQKNQISFFDAMRSATNMSILEPVFYQIKKNDPYHIRIESTHPSEDAGIYNLCFTVIFDRQVDAATINRFNADCETVTLSFYINQNVQFLDEAPSIEKQNQSSCILQ